MIDDVVEKGPEQSGSFLASSYSSYLHLIWLMPIELLLAWHDYFSPASCQSCHSVLVIGINWGASGQPGSISDTSLLSLEQRPELLRA
jgi:hypothetical protein